MCLLSPYQCVYTVMSAIEPDIGTWLHIENQGLKFSCFNPSHHRAARGNSSLRTSTDLTATIPSRRWKRHQPWTRSVPTTVNRFEKYTSRYLASHKQNHVTSHFSTDQTSVLSCIYTRILTKCESKESVNTFPKQVITPARGPLNCYFPITSVMWIYSQMHF